MCHFECRITPAFAGNSTLHRDGQANLQHPLQARNVKVIGKMIAVAVSSSSQAVSTR